MLWIKLLSSLLIFYLASISDAANPFCAQNDPSPLNVTNRELPRNVCQAQCEDFYMKNPGARPQGGPDRVCKSTLQTILRPFDVAQDIRNKVACVSGLAEGSLQGLENAWEGIVSLSHAVDQHVRDRVKWVKQCQSEVACRRALAREIPPNHERNSDGTYKVPDTEVDRIWSNRDVVQLESLATKGRANRAGRCTKQIQAWLEEHGSNIEAVKKLTGHEHEDCFRQFVEVVINTPQTGKHSNLMEGALQWLNKLGVELQCYPEEETLRLICLGMAGFLVDPTLIAGGALGVAGKVVKLARVRGATRGFTRAAEETQAGIRAAAASGPYRADDFPISRLWMGDRANHEAYSKWASRAANQIEDDISAGKSLREIMGETAKSRQQFAIGNNQSYSSQFGELREADNLARTPIIRNLEDGRNMEDLFKLIDRRFSNGQNASSTSMIRYQTLTGETIDSTFVIGERGAERAMLYHTSPANAKKIMDDVYARLERIQRSPTLPESKKMDEFLTAMYGYYNAMPYARGSASIGNVFFAGLYKRLFQRRMPALVDGVDVQAMVTSQEQFLNLMRPRILSP